MPGVEGGEKPVARRVHLAAASPCQLTADDRVVPLEQLAPGTVARFGHSRRRVDDVGEEHRDEDPVRLLIERVGLPGLLQERLDRVDHERYVCQSGDVPRDRDLGVSGTRDAIGEVARAVVGDPPVVGVLEDERGDRDRGEHVADVGLDVHPFVRVLVARAEAVPEHAGECGLFLCRGGW